MTPAIEAKAAEKPTYRKKAKISRDRCPAGRNNQKERQ